jgi:hypothetical protein
MTEETEVDFAMKYSEERKLRLALETRMQAMVFECVPFIAATAELIDLVIHGDKADEMAKMVKVLIDWQADMEVVVMINLFDPVSDTPRIAIEDIDKHGSLQNLPRSVTAPIHKALRARTKEVRAQWQELSERTCIASADELTQNYVNHCKQRIAEASERRGLNPS